jgi:hypothetical protein
MGKWWKNKNMVPVQEPYLNEGKNILLNTDCSDPANSIFYEVSVPNAYHLSGIVWDNNEFVNHINFLAPAPFISIGHNANRSRDIVVFYYPMGVRDPWEEEIPLCSHEWFYFLKQIILAAEEVQKTFSVTQEDQVIKKNNHSWLVMSYEFQTAKLASLFKPE